MDTELVGFVTLAALILGLFAWPRRDVRQSRQETSGRIDGSRVETGALRERAARIEGLLEAVFVRRNLTPPPDPPAPEPRNQSRAA